MAAGLAFGAWFLMHPQPAIAFAERDWVVVGDLRNLTGDAKLDESLEQAFRISLEQSHYVNVLSDLKVRETLANMQQFSFARFYHGQSKLSARQAQQIDGRFHRNRVGRNKHQSKNWQQFTMNPHRLFLVPRIKGGNHFLHPLTN